jgi:hypothetical protein
LKGAEATDEQTKAELENTLMDKRTWAASIASEYRTAQLQSDADRQMFKNGVGAEVTAKNPKSRPKNW